MAENSVRISSLKDRTSKSLAGWEIASVVVSCLIAEWIVLSLGGTQRWLIVIPALMALGLMIFSHYERRESLQDLGFRMDNFTAATRLLAVPTLVATIAVLVGGWLLSEAFVVRPPGVRHLTLPLWALFQQYALHGFINRRAQNVLGKGVASVLLVAVLFSLLHLPNPLLTVLTFIGGAIWALVYQRQPNLWVLALSHTIISLTLALTFPKGWIDSLRVGFKYLV